MGLLLLIIDVVLVVGRSPKLESFSQLGSRFERGRGTPLAVGFGTDFHGSSIPGLLSNVLSLVDERSCLCFLGY